jgi:hypothetical protein
MINIALVGDYNSKVIAHQTIPGALRYSSEFLNIDTEFE